LIWGVRSDVIMFDPQRPDRVDCFRFSTWGLFFLHSAWLGCRVWDWNLLFLLLPSVHETEGSCILICSISLFDLQHFRRLVCVEWEDTAIAFIGGREQNGGHKEPKSWSLCHNFSTNSPFFIGLFLRRLRKGGDGDIGTIYIYHTICSNAAATGLLIIVKIDFSDRNFSFHRWNVLDGEVGDMPCSCRDGKMDSSRDYTQN
jgi:hypothetical protein